MGFVSGTAAIFGGVFQSYIPVKLTAARAGLVMETNARVKLRGVEVGRVKAVTAHHGTAELQLEIYPDQIQFIPSNVEARIQATTVFGAKFVELVYPPDPSPQHLAAGAVLHSQNVSTEVNTIFQNVSDLLKMIDPAKLNAILTAVADGVRGQGPRMGEATTDLKEVLAVLNSRSDTIGQDWRSLKDFNNTYAAAASDIVSVLNNAATTATTIVDHSAQLDQLLTNVIGLSTSGTDLLGASSKNLVGLVDTLEPTTQLLREYSPTYACTLEGATWYLNHGGFDAWGGHDGRSIQFDVGLLLGNDPYRYPDNLPIVAAKGGPGGSPAVDHYRTSPKTSQCGKWLRIPAGALAWTSGLIPGLGTRVGPTISRSPAPSRRRRASDSVCLDRRRDPSRIRARRPMVPRSMVPAASRCGRNPAGRAGFCADGRRRTTTGRAASIASGGTTIACRATAAAGCHAASAVIAAQQGKERS